MTDVFISYASEDRDRAGKLASALSAFNWSVWWDRKIIIGQAFDQAIEHELETAKSVVVLWSKHSIASEWVKNEAAVASERGVLVPAIIDSVKLPLEFRRKQTAELIDWNGEPSHSGFQALCEGIATTIGGAPLHQPIARQEQKVWWSSRWALATITAIAVAVGLGVYSSLGPWRTMTSTPIAQSDRSETSRPPESKKPVGAVAEIADLVVGTYSGDVIADSKGGSHSNVGLTITKLDGSTIRVTSDYRRLGTVNVMLTRIGNQILNADGDTPFMVDLDRNPPTLLFDPHSEVAYRGNKQK
ncbi:MAG TPA: toll/interleukin-1 receptor domain-containing protein [Azonexus sp.]|nr:toll/interleukin-1 receptor domain-containing protein [Azonexus sp.]